MVIPESIWTNNMLATKILRGEYPPQIENATTTVMDPKAKVGGIEAVIAVKTSGEAWNTIRSMLKKNATQNETYRITQVPTDELPLLTLIPTIMRAVPWEHIDPPDWNPLEKIREQVRNVE